MRTKLLIGLLVLGMVVVGFSTFALQDARAVVPHVVDGPVGPSVAPGLGNPSNPASATFYLTNKATYPVQTLPDLFDADGTNTAYYGKDIGSNWSEGSLAWAAGDNVVVVIETIRGQNGWTGANYTTSSDGVLTTANIDSLPNANIEALPTIALVKWPGAIDVQWTGLTDTNGNVLSYEVYRAPSPGAAWTTIGRSGAQVPAGAMNFNNTGLASANYCYKIAANYRRTTAGGVYTTTGTSEPQCTALGTAPTIQSTSPVDAETGITTLQNIVVVFSEPMTPGSLTWNLVPPGGITFTPNWNLAFDTLTLSHTTPFAQCQGYTMTIRARDANDNFMLVNGPVPNPWTFSTTCPSPLITAVTPADGSTGVRRTQSIVITFSKAMDTATVSATPSPVVTCVWGWNAPTNTVYTCTHAALFTAGQLYSVTVVGSDTAGNPLVAGAIPNPFSFTANSPPAVTVSAPLASVCWTGASAHDIAWTMSDTTTATASLVVWINYTTGGSPVLITGPITGRPSPTTYTWTVASINNVNVQVTIDVADGAGEVGRGTSGTFEIDSTAPTVVSTNPAASATGVATSSTIVVTFSEAMTRAAVEGATLISPNIGYAASWNTPTDTVMTLTPSAAMAANTQYTVTVGTGAVDACSPGSPLASARVFSFRTAGVRPNAPSAVTAVAASATTVSLSWTAPTTYSDGSSLPSSAIEGYYIERATSATGTRTNLTSAGVVTTTSFSDTGLTAGQAYYYWVRTKLVDGRVSDDSTPANLTLSNQAPDLTCGSC